MNWLFTDMDAFFASVEQMLRPELRKRPVAIIPTESDTTSVIAASYEAKAFGVKTGTRVWDAKRMCPGIVLVKARPSLYVKIHNDILASVEKCAPIHKVYSIDEWSVRLRGIEKNEANAREIARQIKRRILDDFGPWMTCSVGIAPSRLLAKIASGLGKPNGLTTLCVDELPGRLEHLRLKDLCGISDGMMARFDRHGIRTIRDLWELTRDEAVRVWGSVSGAQWWAGFHGDDEPELPTQRRSMSHGSVLAPRMRDDESARCILIRLTCKLAQRLRRNGYCARSMSVSAGYERAGTFFERIDVPCTNDTPTLLRLFERVWLKRVSNKGQIRKVDVTVSDLVLESQVTRSLFDEVNKLQRLSRAVDQINLRWGAQSIYFGPVHDYRHPMENKIAFGRIPEEWD